MGSFKLKDLSLNKLEYGSGAAACAFDGNTRYVRITDIDDDGELGIDIVSPSSIDEKYLLNDGDVLFARTGATVGKTYLYKKSDGHCIYAGFLIRVVPNQKIIQPKYLFYYTKSPKYKRFVQNSMKIVAQPNINAKQYGELEINIPTIDEQKTIVDRLNKVSTIMNTRKSELSKLDELIKARFVEMFGNPVANEKGWKLARLGDLATKIGSGATPKGGRESYGAEGISLIRSMNVHCGRFEDKELAHISDEQAARLENVTVERQDVLLNITGASVARCCVVPEDVLPARVNQHVCIIRCREYISPGFLSNMLIDDNYQDLLWKIAGSGATREAITKQQVENLQIIVPPNELQEQFVNFVAQVDKSKVAVKKSLDENQKLFDCLMQQYFG